MQVEKLRSLIRESISEYIKEIDEAGTRAMYEAKMKACDDAMSARKKKIEMAESLEEMQGMFDETKMGDLKKEIKLLEKQKAKYGKMLEKMNKGKEVVTEEPTDEAPVDEADVTAEMELSGEESKALEDKAKKNDEEYNIMNESFLKMQKLAGVITESQYNSKKKALVENQVNEAGIVSKVKGALGFKDYSKDPGVIYAKKMIDDYVKDKKLTPDEGKKVLAGITEWIKWYVKDMQVPDYFETYPPNDKNPDGAVQKMWIKLSDLIKKIAPNSELNHSKPSSYDYDDSAIGQQSRIGR